jgi:hypothetical protein
MLTRLKRLTKDDIIKEVYYDITDGYGSIQSTYKKAKEINNTITFDEVKKWMSRQPNGQIKGYRGFNSYNAPYARFEYQIDIMDMTNLQTDSDQPRYALTVIDIFSKKADALPMKNKDSNSVYNDLLTIFNNGIPDECIFRWRRCL